MKRMSKDDLRTPYLKLMLYGQPGSTKTRTSGTAALDERSAPCLMLSSAGNPESIKDYDPLPDIIVMEELKDYNLWYEWLSMGQPADKKIVEEFDLHPPYKSLVIDGMTEIQRFSFDVVIGNKDKVGPGDIPAAAQIQHFGRVLGQMVTFTRLFFALPMHVIITSLERVDNDQNTGGFEYKPLLWGQSAGEVPGYALAVARLVHRARIDYKMTKAITEASASGILEDTLTQDTTAVALFKPSGKYVAKDQYGSIGAFMLDPTVAKILDRIQTSRSGS
jgi:hypothetical protein